MNILDLLTTGNYLIYNKEIAKKIGVEETILLGELCNEYNYYLKNNKLVNGFFYSTQKNIYENTGINEYKQRKILKELESKKIIEVKLEGIPAKKWYRINEDQLIKILNISYLKNDDKDIENLNTKMSNNSNSRCLNFKELDVEKLNINNNNINNNNYNNNKNNINNSINKNNNKDINIYSSSGEEQCESSLDIDKIIEEKNKSDIVDIIEYLNFKAGTNFKSTTKKTQTLIRARFKEGFTINDFKIVIDKKVRDWIDNKDMCMYLRPETLFGNKFEGYLNQREREFTSRDIAKHIDLRGALD